MWTSSLFMGGMLLFPTFTHAEEMPTFTEAKTIIVKEEWKTVTNAPLTNSSLTGKTEMKETKKENVLTQEQTEEEKLWEEMNKPSFSFLPIPEKLEIIERFQTIQMKKVEVTLSDLQTKQPSQTLEREEEILKQSIAWLEKKNGMTKEMMTTILSMKVAEKEQMKESFRLFLDENKQYKEQVRLLNEKIAQQKETMYMHTQQHLHTQLIQETNKMKAYEKIKEKYNVGDRSRETTERLLAFAKENNLSIFSFNGSLVEQEKGFIQEGNELYISLEMLENIPSFQVISTMNKENKTFSIQEKDHVLTYKEERFFWNDREIGYGNKMKMINGQPYVYAPFVFSLFQYNITTNESHFITVVPNVLMKDEMELMETEKILWTIF